MTKREIRKQVGLLEQLISVLQKKEEFIFKQRPFLLDLSLPMEVVDLPKNEKEKQVENDLEIKVILQELGIIKSIKEYILDKENKFNFLENRNITIYDALKDSSLQKVEKQLAWEMFKWDHLSDEYRESHTQVVQEKLSDIKRSI